MGCRMDAVHEISVNRMGSSSSELVGEQVYCQWAAIFWKAFSSWVVALNSGPKIFNSFAVKQMCCYQSFIVPFIEHSQNT